VLLAGGVDAIATITPDQRQALWELARTFDLMPKLRAAEGHSLDATNPGNRPGDHFSNRASWEDVLLPHGWVKVHQRGEVSYWRRPGKEVGVSATTNWQGSDLLYVFSTSTIFEPERGYAKFSAYSLLEHGGDFQAAARSLSRQGYGKSSPISPKTHHRPHVITSWEVRG
jgi:putative DNA primase/helicase